MPIPPRCQTAYRPGWGCWVALLFLVVGALFSTPPLAFAEEPVRDAFGREVRVSAAKRILTLGADVSEIVVALGAEDRIVAVDRGSTYPETLKQKPNVGYRRALSAEGVISLAPELILASEDAGPSTAIDILKSLSTPLVFVPEKNTLEGMIAKIELISRTLGLEEEGKALAARVTADFNAATALAGRVPAERRRRVVFFHGLLKLTAAGEGTAANAIISYAGGINPLDFKGYKSVSEESLVEIAPEVVVMMPDDKGGPTPEEVFSIPALKTTPAARDKALIVLKGAYMINFGPRTAGAIRDIAAALYPDVLAGENVAQ